MYTGLHDSQLAVLPGADRGGGTLPHPFLCRGLCGVQEESSHRVALHLRHPRQLVPGAGCNRLTALKQVRPSGCVASAMAAALQREACICLGAPGSQPEAVTAGMAAGSWAAVFLPTSKIQLKTRQPPLYSMYSSNTDSICFCCVYVYIH